MEDKWKPNLFIPGFAKCGTTELCDYLSQHHDIFLPWEKEPNTFYDLEKYPAYFSGDPTGTMKHTIMTLDEYRKLFSAPRKYRYRIDGTVSYTFSTKFARVLKDFAEDAKMIILIRNQKQRLVSMYFFSMIRHKQDDFRKWLADYFVPYMETYLYLDKIISYYEAFGQELRIIETSNLGSPEVHKQIFEYLNLEPIKIEITHKNPSLLTPDDSQTYRNIILGLTSVKLKVFNIAKSVGLENEFNRTAYFVGDRVRELVSHNRKKTDYSALINMIPSNIVSTFEEDYSKTIDYALQKDILIRP